MPNRTSASTPRSLHPPTASRIRRARRGPRRRPRARRVAAWGLAALALLQPLAAEASSPPTGQPTLGQFIQTAKTPAGQPATSGPITRATVNTAVSGPGAPPVSSPGTPTVSSPGTPAGSSPGGPAGGGPGEPATTPAPRAATGLRNYFQLERPADIAPDDIAPDSEFPVPPSPPISESEPARDLGQSELGQSQPTARLRSADKRRADEPSEERGFAAESTTRNEAPPSSPVRAWTPAAARTADQHEAAGARPGRQPLLPGFNIFRHVPLAKTSQDAKSAVGAHRPPSKFTPPAGQWRAVKRPTASRQAAEPRPERPESHRVTSAADTEPATLGTSPTEPALLPTPSANLLTGMAAAASGVPEQARSAPAHPVSPASPSAPTDSVAKHETKQETKDHQETNLAADKVAESSRRPAAGRQDSQGNSSHLPRRPVAGYATAGTERLRQQADLLRDLLTHRPAKEERARPPARVAQIPQSSPAEMTKRSSQQNAEPALQASEQTSRRMSEQPTPLAAVATTPASDASSRRAEPLLLSEVIKAAMLAHQPATTHPEVAAAKRYLELRRDWITRRQLRGASSPESSESLVSVANHQTAAQPERRAAQPVEPLPLQPPPDAEVEPSLERELGSPSVPVPQLPVPAEPPAGQAPAVEDSQPPVEEIAPGSKHLTAEEKELWRKIDQYGRLRSIQKIDLNIQPFTHGEPNETDQLAADVVPGNAAALLLRDRQTVRYVSGPPQPGINYSALLGLADYCHRPLYFQQVNVERYGTHRPVLQPIFSAVQFFAAVPALPYKMTIQRPNICYYYDHPFEAGRPAPWERQLPPLNAKAALVEGAVIMGLIILIP